MAEKPAPVARFSAAGLLTLVGFGSGCAAGCPEGHRQEQDVCVQSVAPAPHRCSGLPTTKADPHGEGLFARVDVLGGDCIWMDMTEVTVEAYQRFLADTPAESVVWEPTWCAWKTQRSEPIDNPADACSASITRVDQPFAPRKPIRCVDFCDAEAFCQYAGKRLCYGGGTALQGPRGFPREWVLACTNGLETVYPWGDDATGGDCNVGAPPDCVDCGAYVVGHQQLCRNANGVTDLLGNIAEWTFSCNFVPVGQESTPSGCMVRGGGFDQPLQACSGEAVVPNDSRRGNLGFRCCSDLTTDEVLAIAD